MKLRNKKTGEIKEVEKGHFLIVYEDDYEATYVTSLAELCEEWEDYEEPKGTYFINTQGDVQFWDSSSFAYPDDWTKEKEIGNHFETKEEAEKAVEKLKALTRLNEAGLKIEVENVSDIDSITDGYVDFDLHCYFKRYDGFGEDMDTLFSQEDD